MLFQDCVEHRDCIGDHVDEHDADGHADDCADILAEDDQGPGALASSISSNAIVDASHGSHCCIVHSIIY